ncbi:acetyl-CoA C-acetyltransferase [Henriciella barbarensis]|uniref:Acetyl-CoA C-acetyltransferase n=1 Tax=Henriciella barbarensis TaxID=86342 RepID=A0A399R4L4_9PROT|nr:MULTISPECIES: acetyl-CoA C-acetyltransferase [Henriciella]RIJ24642.1 acetyl-CoA C-acetyltransferase [Henriciella barbarensis]
MPHAAYIFDAVRTPRGKGKPDGSLHEVKPVRLVADLLTALQTRYDLDTAMVSDVVLGCGQALGEQGGAIGKAAALMAGWDDSVAGCQVDRFCGSGLETVNSAATRIMSGMEDLIVAGGVESMSRIPMGSGGGALFFDSELMTKAGSVSQGVSADLIATIGGYTREDVDAFALGSQLKAAEAQANGYFDKSLVPVRDAVGQTILSHDEFVKPKTTMEGLGALKPSFAKMGAMGMDAVCLAKYPEVASIDHVHTAGNSSGVVDGASAVLIGSEAAAKNLNLTPRGRIVSMALVSTEPTIMLTGPAPAVTKLLGRTGLSVDDIDLFEVNEAFASVVLRFRDELNVPEEKINVNGGAIALGHPIGATGGMLVGTVLDELERRKLKRGVCVLCIGGGMGIATLIERI